MVRSNWGQTLQLNLKLTKEEADMERKTIVVSLMTVLFVTSVATLAQWATKPRSKA